MIKISTSQNAPIKVPVEKGKSYHWCSYGFSGKQPFSDGSHKESEKTPIKFDANESKDVFFCNCKQTKDQPFCDGSHSK